MKLDKQKFLEVFDKSFGVMTTACEKYGVTRKTVWDAAKKDEAFAAALEEVKEKRLDLAESQLLKRIMNEDTTAIIFYLKTQGRHRGYFERHEVAVEGDEDIKAMAREFFAKDK